MSEKWGLWHLPSQDWCLSNNERIEKASRDEVLKESTWGKYVEARPILPSSDPVNRPSHYTRFGAAEVIDIVEYLNFCRGNAIKYIARAGAKDVSKEIEDLEKAQWYLTREIARLKKASNK